MDTAQNFNKDTHTSPLCFWKGFFALLDMADLIPTLNPYTQQAHNSHSFSLGYRENSHLTTDNETFGLTTRKYLCSPFLEYDGEDKNNTGLMMQTCSFRAHANTHTFSSLEPDSLEVNLMERKRKIADISIQCAPSPLVSFPGQPWLGWALAVSIWERDYTCCPRLFTYACAVPVVWIEPTFPL